VETEFSRIKRLPPYVFAIVNELKMAQRRLGEDIIDFGMGNPDRPPPRHVVDKLVEAAQRRDTHRYSMSRGIPRLRRAVCNWYRDRYAVELDPESEAIVTLGSKEGLAHLAMAVVEKGDLVLVPSPAYPIHPFGFIIAGADVRNVPIGPGIDFFSELQTAVRENEIWVIQDLAYADIVFDGYRAPSILQVPGAKEIAVEFFSLSKSYNMPGWRVGFMVGSRVLVKALAQLKSYLDYGMFTPIQVAAITALEEDQSCLEEIRETYRSRRDVLCNGLDSIGWTVEKPKATMFVWAPIPPAYRELGSLEFSKRLLLEAKVAVSPGVGFGEHGDGYVRFALIENEHRTRQAIRGIRNMFREGNERSLRAV